MVSLTIRDRIILHLFELQKYEEDFEVPIEVTQAGIADIVGGRRAYISSILTDLLNEELVNEKLSRIKGIGRRRRAYFLTWKGKKLAGELYNELKKIKLKVIKKSGELVELEVENIIETLPRKISLVELFNISSKKELIDIAHIQTPSLQYIDYSKDAPNIRSFFGREEEIKKINDWFNNTKIIVIYGLPGIGKTTLALKIKEEYKNKKNIYWFKFHEWTSLQMTLIGIGEFLSAIEGKQIKISSLELASIYSTIEKVLRKKDVLFIFDDFNNANEDIVRFFRAFKEIIEKEKDCICIIISRELPKIYDRADVLIKKTVKEMRLGALSKDAVKSFLASKGLKNIEKIYEKVGGYPLFLEFIALSGGEISSDINKYIREEIVRKLSAIDEKILKIGSVYRKPVGIDAFFGFLEKESIYKSINKFVDSAIMYEYPDERYELNEIIKDFFYGSLPMNEKLDYHSKSAAYYLSFSSLDGYIEALYHLIKGKKYEEGAGVILSHGKELIEKNYSTECMEFLRALMPNLPKYYSRLGKLKNDILDRWGKWDVVMEAFKLMKIICYYSYIETENINRIFEKDKKWHDGLKKLEDSLEILKKSNDLHGCSEIYKTTAWLYWRIGDIKNAEKFYNESIKLLKKLGEKENLGICYIELGGIMRDVRKGIENVEHGINLVGLENKSNIVRAKALLGNLYMEIGEDTKGIGKLEEALKLAEEIDFMRGKGYISLSFAYWYVRKGFLNKASAKIIDAKKIFEKLNDDIGKGNACVLHGIIDFLAQRYVESINELRGAIEKLKTWEEMKPYLALTYLFISIVVRKAGMISTEIKNAWEILDGYNWETLKGIERYRI